MNPTPKQLAVLRAVRHNDYTAYNGGDPKPGYVFDAGHWSVWSDCIDCCSKEICDELPKGRSLAGVVGSAVAAGLLGSDGECVWLTEAGWNALTAAK